MTADGSDLWISQNLGNTFGMDAAESFSAASIFFGVRDDLFARRHFGFADIDIVD